MKPGIKTSEFWVGVLTAPIVTIIVALLSTLGIEVTEATIAAMISPALVYIFGRGWMKAKAEESKPAPTEENA